MRRTILRCNITILQRNIVRVLEGVCILYWPVIENQPHSSYPSNRRHNKCVWQVNLKRAIYRQDLTIKSRLNKIIKSSFISQNAASVAKPHVLKLFTDTYSAEASSLPCHVEMLTTFPLCSFM